ncbi:Uncharacterized protein conserved in bacteria [Leclercia adecarboxylata]|uniref:Uncharacterized protein conserved in bacteria n=1 Tax=Leclercia adecarboxylata TaxID=83655 RepID=A0A4U9HSK1_9ENTR|nr:Uncharacterized protein conserved in bacteria [Leclercia adecarboxylata]
MRESCQVTDVEATPDGVNILTDDDAAPKLFDLAVIATGHVWPDETPRRVPTSQPLVRADGGRHSRLQRGDYGTSLSGLDAAMAVAVQHGKFIETDNEQIHYQLDEGSEALKIVLMSRSGICLKPTFTAQSLTSH